MRTYKGIMHTIWETAYKVRQRTVGTGQQALPTQCSFLNVFTANHPWILWGVGVYVKFRQGWGWVFTWTWVFARTDSVYITRFM